jgi:hypothetical protein
MLPFMGVDLGLCACFRKDASVFSGVISEVTRALCIDSRNQPKEKRTTTAVLAGSPSLESAMTLQPQSRGLLAAPNPATNMPAQTSMHPPPRLQAHLANQPKINHSRSRRVRKFPGDFRLRITPQMPNFGLIVHRS